MNSTAVIDFTSATFLGIILARYLTDRSRSKNYAEWGLCLCLIFVLICDGLAMSLKGPEYPVALRYFVTFISMLIGAGLILLVYTIYSENVIRQKTKISPWIFKSLKFVAVAWLVAAVVCVFANNMLSYPNGVERLDSDFPLFIAIAEIIIIISPPAIAIALRKKIGTQTMLLILSLVFIPGVAFGLYAFTEIDVTYASCAISFVFVNEFILKRQAEEEKIAQAEERLELERAAADAASLAKSNFLFSMSHDIRTPMNAIKGFTAMAKKYANDEEKVVEYLDKIDISGQQLLTLINQVLEMARIESGKVELEEKPVNIQKEFNALVTVLEEQANVNERKFTHSLEKIEHNYVFADEARMSSITMNIVGNAMKYTPEGGCIDFRLKEIESRKPGYATLVLTVEDNGIGMSREFLEELYKPFTREKNSTVSKVQGTGLGMAIVKSIVDLLGGTIDVWSELGKGTRFDITIDMRINENAAPEKETEEIEAAVFKDKRILLVEDNEMNLEIAEHILHEQGLVVESVTDGDIAVNRVKKAFDRGDYNYYDVILMDIQMPRMNGFEATKAIRAMEPEDLHIPIIAMTANAFEEDRKNVLAAGMDEHLAKPFNVPKMLMTIARFL